MNCDRAITALRGLEAREPGAGAAQGDEMDELVALGLAVEADPTLLEQLRRLHALRAEYAEFFSVSVDPFSPDPFRSALDDVQRKLRDEWYRLRTSKMSLQNQEENRVLLRQAVGALSDPATAAMLRKTAAEGALVAPGALLVPCPALGRALFAITAKGRRVLSDLGVRIGRFSGAPLVAFMKQFDKAEAKMNAFAGEIRSLDARVGYVRKGKTQVVIGLAKSGLPAEQAIGLYQGALQQTRAPDTAVTCTRNAAQEGSPAQVHQKLEQAYQALLRAGFPPLPVVRGVAKSLLPYSPPEAGVARFVELFQWLRQAFGQSDEIYKLVARLMPASGGPAELVRRSTRAAQLLGPAGTPRAYVALASMMKEDAALPALCGRFVEISHGLLRARLCSPADAEGHALECVACPGTPDEVVTLVARLGAQISGGGQPSGEALSIAAAFVKRFAY